MSNRKLPFSLLALIILTTFLSAASFADKAEDAAIAVAGARVKAEFAVKAALLAADENRSGWASTWQLCEIIRNKTYTLYEQRAQAEEQKDESVRDQTVLDEVQARLADLRESWDTFNAKDRSALNIAFQDANEAATHLNQVLDSLNTAERAWRDASLDPAALQSAYDSVTKRATELRAIAEKTLSVAQAKQKALQADLDTARTYVGKSNKNTP